VHSASRQHLSVSRLSLAIWLAVLLVLSGQTASSARAPASRAMSVLDAATVFCHAGRDADHRKPVLPDHAGQAAVLQASLAGVHHFRISAIVPAVPPPAVLRAARPGVPQARAPPGRPAPANPARGPPQSV
jgi:hypothetical protein